MIHFLSGIIAQKSEDSVVIAVGGVGFHITIPVSTYRELPPVNEPVVLHTHLHVREDELRLFGFFSEEERGMFEVLISVSGVGAKMAVDMISHLPAEQFIRAVQTEDITLLCQAPGIGKKRAERLVFDLKNSKHILFLRPAVSAKKKIDVEVDDAALPPQGSSAQEALEALMALGLKPIEAQRAVSKAVDALDDPSTETRELIKEALKHR